MRINTHKCDGCGAQKGELNHWFRVVANASFGIFTWQDADVDEFEEKHYCSDACVIKAAQQWLSAQKEAA